ncbi:hypothetical protein [Archaeoglobus neptunius]|uniref:hypothetical protein n=1 Tax=Archaeoglobus neptunius TaxID=2798580 RepID=UPI00192936EE|nr:hypothetical protein [Archaeoglobus neptunius]
MYEVKDWNEEVMKWLAVGLCLAMVGMAVMPMAVGDATAVYAYYSGEDMNPYLASGGLIAGFGFMKASDLLLVAELAGVATAGVGAAVLVGIGVGVIA